MIELINHLFDYSKRFPTHGSMYIYEAFGLLESLKRKQ